MAFHKQPPAPPSSRPAPSSSREGIRFVSRLECGVDEWNDFVQASPDGWPGAIYQWLDMTADVTEWKIKDLSFAVVEKDRLIAIMPLGFSPAFNRLASPYWGQSGPVMTAGLHPAVQRNLTDIILDRAKAIGVEMGATYFDIMVNPTTERSVCNRWGVNPFLRYGMEDVSSHSRIIELNKKKSQLWKELSKDARYQVRQAEASGYKIEVREWPREVSTYYDIHKETYQRTEATPHPKAYFQGIADVIWPLSQAILRAAVDSSGEVVAYMNILRFGCRYHYWTSCSKNSHINSGVNYLLLWTSIAAAADENGEWFEIGEVFPNSDRPKDIGLTIFKSKFGGEVHRLFRAQLTFPPASDEAVTEVHPTDCVKKNESIQKSQPPCISESLILCREAVRMLLAALWRRFCRIIAGTSRE